MCRGVASVHIVATEFIPLKKKENKISAVGTEHISEKKLNDYTEK